MAIKLEDRKYTVYCHVFPNGKRYVGQTCYPINHRFGKDGNHYQGQPYLYNAIKKYGWESVQHEVLAENLSYLEVDAVEQFYIILYKSNQKEFGYNIEGGGSLHKVCTEETKERLRKMNLGKKLSPETRKKMSESQKGEKNCNYGKHFSEEVRRRMSEGQKGKISGKRGIPLSEEQKQKIRLTLLGRKSNTVYTPELRALISRRIRETMTPERRKAISDRMLGGKHPGAKAIFVYDSIDRSIAKYDAVIEFARKLNINHKRIDRAIKNKHWLDGRYLISYTKEELSCQVLT